jgi:hypothetical protein
MCGRFAARDRISGRVSALRSLAGQRREGLPRVYAGAISGHWESPPVQRIRCNKAPKVTHGDSSRQLPITRNEGVPGSSPGVGFPRFAGIFWSDRGLSEGVEGSTRGLPSEVLNGKQAVLQAFLLTKTRAGTVRSLSSRVRSSRLQSVRVQTDPRCQSERGLDLARFGDGGGSVELHDRRAGERARSPYRAASCAGNELRPVKSSPPACAIAHPLPRRVRPRPARERHLARSSRPRLRARRTANRPARSRRGRRRESHPRRRRV